MIIQNTDGEEVEVLTAEEAQEQTQSAIKSAIEDYIAGNPSDTSAIDELKETIKALETKITASKKSDSSKETVDLTEQLDAIKATISEQLTGFKNELAGETKAEMLDKLSGNDVELKKKIEFEFNNYRAGDTSKSAIAERMQKAYTLATGNQPTPSFMDNSASGGGKGNTKQQKDENGMNDNAKEMAKMFGLSEEDIKKYTKK